jgi:hypothetical protein
MTAKEKAKELVDDMYCEMHNLCITDEVLNEVAKNCALIAINEVINYIQDKSDWYWEEVKEEVINI